MVVLGCYMRFRLLFYINKDIKILIWGIVVGLYFGNRVKQVFWFYMMCFEIEYNKN